MSQINEPIQKLRVFICHASQDKPLVRELYQRLRNEDWIHPWLDEKELHPGEDWRILIDKAVEEAHVVMICLSKNSINKEGFIQKELRYAREISLEKPEGMLFLIPVRLENCDIPRSLRFIQWVNYFGQDKDQNYMVLLESFKIRHKQIIRLEEGQNLLKQDEHRSKPDLQPIINVMSDYYDRLDNLARNPDLFFGVPTGFIDLDRILIGLQPSNFIIVASLPGHGITSLLFSIARNASLLHKKHIAIFLSSGMSNEQAMQRFIARETGIDTRFLHTGRIEDNEWPLINHAMEVLSDSHIFLDDTPSITIPEIKARCLNLALNSQLDLVIVDNLQFLGGNENILEPNKNPNYIDLKVLSLELNVPVLAGIQLTRGIERRIDKRPTLIDLDKFGSLEPSADVVLFLYRPELYEKKSNKMNIAEVIVAKNKYGPIGATELVFIEKLATFYDSATRDFGLTQE
jgi:replicative DNA helicase